MCSLRLEGGGATGDFTFTGNRGMVQSSARYNTQYTIRSAQMNISTFEAHLRSKFLHEPCPSPPAMTLHYYSYLVCV